MHRNAWAWKAIKGAIFRPESQLSFSSRRVHIVSAEERERILTAVSYHPSIVAGLGPRDPNLTTNRRYLLSPVDVFNPGSGRLLPTSRGYFFHTYPTNFGVSGIINY